MYVLSKICSSEMTLKVIAAISGLLLIKISASLSPPPACKENGIYADPEDCTKFYMCSPCGPLQFYCPAGDLFDPEKKACVRDEDHKCEPRSFLPSSQDVITPDVDITFVPNNFSCMIMVAVEDDGMEDLGPEDRYMSAPDSLNISANADFRDSGEPTGQSEKSNVTQSKMFADSPVEIVDDVNNTNEFDIHQFSENANIEIFEIGSTTKITDNSPLLDIIEKGSTTNGESTLSEIDNFSIISKEYSEKNVSRLSLEEEVISGDIAQNNSENSLLRSKEDITSNDTHSLLISSELDNSNNATEAITNDFARRVTNFTSEGQTNMNASIASNGSKDQTNRANFKDISKNFNLVTHDNDTSITSLDTNANIEKVAHSKYSALDSKDMEAKATNFTIVPNTSSEVTNVNDANIEDTSEIIQTGITREFTVIKEVDSADINISDNNMGLGKVTTTIFEEEKMRGEDPRINIEPSNIPAAILRNNTKIGSASTPEQLLVDKILDDMVVTEGTVPDQIHISNIQTTQSDADNANFNTVETTSTPMPRSSASPGISDLVRDLLDDISDYQELINGMKENLNEMIKSAPSHDDMENSTVAVSGAVAEHLFSKSDRHQYHKLSSYIALICCLYNIIIHRLEDTTLLIRVSVAFFKFTHNMNNMVETEKLISLVYDRKPLWDVASKSYHNRDVARKLWQEIAEELKSPSEVIKAKWQNLRDHCRREHANISKVPTGSAVLDATQISAWRHYKQLLFLTDAFSSRKMKTNIPPVSSQTSELADILNEEEEEEDGVIASDIISDPDRAASNNIVAIQETENVSSHSPKSFRKPIMAIKRKTGKPNALVKLLALEQKKVEQLEKRYERSNVSEDLNKDEDYHFLMSLLPHLRDIPKRKKLETRMHLQQVLMNAEQTEETRPSSAISSYSYNYSPQCSTT
nr:unnamed protein product [Callosobruchus analis]